MSNLSNIGSLQNSGRQIDNFHNSPKAINGIGIDHGWKLHADLVADLTYEESLLKMGRTFTGGSVSVANKAVADAFDARLSSLGLDINEFLNYQKFAYKNPSTAMTRGLPGGYLNSASGFKFIDPNDTLTTIEILQKNNVQFKMGPAEYGAGRHMTIYAQSLENRDRIISELEGSIGHRLVDQNDPAYRTALGTGSTSPADVGVKNHPLSRGVSGRFTTDYLGVDASGRIDISSSIAGAPAAPAEYLVTGQINPEQIDRINRVTTEVPEMAELLHGQAGYVSPYKTIEQIAAERVSGVIPHSPSAGPAYTGSLPGINRPGSSPVPVIPIQPTPKPTPSNTPVAPVTPTKPKTPAPKPTVKPKTPTVKPGKKLPPPGAPGGVIFPGRPVAPVTPSGTPVAPVTPSGTPAAPVTPSGKPVGKTVTPRKPIRRYPKPTPPRYDAEKLNRLRPLPKYKDVLVAGISAAPGSSPAAVASAAATTPAGSSIAFRQMLKNKAADISGSSVIKKFNSMSNAKITTGGLAAAGLLTAISISKNRLSEKDKRR